MNRQVRRATEKAEKKKEKEKAQRKQARLAARATRRATPKKSNKPASKPGRGRDPGRFSGWMTLLTIVFIALQALRAEAGPTTTQLVVDMLFYPLLGYFMGMWLLRRGVQQALWLTVSSGIVLSSLVELAKLLRPGISAEPLLVFLAAPGLLLGFLLARFVHRQSPG